MMASGMAAPRSAPKSESSERVGEHQSTDGGCRAERAGAEPDGDAGKVDDVGEDLDVGVDVDEGDGHRDDRRDEDEADGRPGAQKDGEVEKRVGQLDERIAPGDTGAAGAAASAQARRS